MSTTKTFALLALAGLAACAPKRVNEGPILRNGERVAAPEQVAAASAVGEAQRAQTVAARDSVTALAIATCGGAICDAISRGEVMLGMNEPQVLAATRTTANAWHIRRAGPATVLTPRSLERAPVDAVGSLAMIQLRDGLVRSYSYTESQGVRVVSEPRDATTAGRADALADMLLREGDDYAARGALDEALDRYDRASVLRPQDALVTYRIATVLDKQLRPIEALLQYRLFLHRLELEKIDAIGDAYAKLADAIAHARERVIILERR